MAIVFGILAIVGALVKWEWLVILGGGLTILSDVFGFLSGKLRGCFSTIISYLLGAAFGYFVLSIFGISLFSSILGGIALAGLVGDIAGIIYMKKLMSMNDGD